MPLETSFTNITNRLDITPATVDRQYDKSRGRGRAIKKLAYKFTIPSILLDTASLGIAQKGALVRQLNYTAPSNFRILGWTAAENTLDISNLAIVCIRYRVGSIVTRYRLRLSGNSVAEAAFDIATGMPVPAPIYNQEVIKANFCIEFWSAFGFGETINMKESTVTTNLLTLPINSQETEVLFGAEQQVERGALELPMPEVLPVNYGSYSNWLTN